MPPGGPSRPADPESESPPGPATERPVLPPDAPGPPELRYWEAQALAGRGEYGPARAVLAGLDAEATDRRLRALVRNDLAALAAAEGDLERARAGFAAALELDPDCGPARANLNALAGGEPVAYGEPNTPPAGPPAADRVRVAVLSLLFNWPSTGGGTVHTAELARFLAEAGYEVRHLYARFDPWGVGQVTAPTPHPAEELAFTAAEWNAAAIQARFRRAVDAFDPDYAIVSDSWNFKPLLADAVRPRPYLLRLQALECLCPLNNVRLLTDPDGPPRQCPLHQLARPDACARCVRDRGGYSGDLHRAERELSGVGTGAYREALFRAFADAEAVLVVNPLIEAVVGPYARDVRVVTAGMDPARFPWPPPAEGLPPPTPGRARVLFAGLTREWIKGFHVLRGACAALWEQRRDFELVVTDDPPDGAADPFARYVGWQSQADLPRHLYAADVVAVPAVAQEALGRTAVEAMAAGRPVVASRIGGLQFAVTDGATGLLFEPGDAGDLARKLGALLDDPGLRARLGAEGRRRFEGHYAWPVVVARHYRPLLVPRRAGRPSASPTAPAPAVARVPTPPDRTPDAAAAVGCVLAVRDRPADLVERTLQTYRWQTVRPADCVLLDYGSDPGHAAAYLDLARRYGWRLVRAEPPPPRWWLADAYNRAVAALREDVGVVLKCDADVLLGPEVLAHAARLGRDAFCQFQYLTVPRDVPVPGRFDDPGGLRALLGRLGKDRPSVGQGLFACPAGWFRRVGGFDLAFRGWGYEDHDLRARADRSLPVVEVGWREALLLHQWHPPAADAGAAGNRSYYERMRAGGPVVRNGGRLGPPAPAGRPAGDTYPPPAAGPRGAGRVVVATRSLHDELYRLSGEFLRFDGGDPPERVRVTGAGSADYFRRLAELDADWVVNLDEDAFLLDPAGLLGLVRRMEAEGYAACGMPDGGVVPIRSHNPVACNSCFNVIDLRRARRAWADWDRVLGLRHRPDYERAVAPFARRCAYQFDDFEPYYGAFYALLEAGERILYLDADGWRDGTTTLIRGPGGAPLVLHAWYARDWAADPATRRRYEAVAAYAREYRPPATGLALPGPSLGALHAALARTLVGVVVHDRVPNVLRWLTAWHQSDRGGARLAVVHNHDRPDPAAARAIRDAGPGLYLPRGNVGYDVGAFQDVVGGRYDGVLPGWDFLLWCTDDFVPLRPDFLLRFLDKAADPAVGLVAGRYGYWPGHWSGLDHERHCRTVGFLVRRDVASRLRFPATPVVGREDCLRFEHRPGHLMEQVLGLGYRVAAIDDPSADVMWDSNHERGLDRWPLFRERFGWPAEPGAR